MEGLENLLRPAIRCLRIAARAGSGKGDVVDEVAAREGCFARIDLRARPTGALNEQLVRAWARAPHGVLAVEHVEDADSPAESAQWIAQLVAAARPGSRIVVTQRRELLDPFDRASESATVTLLDRDMALTPQQLRLRVGAAADPRWIGAAHEAAGGWLAPSIALADAFGRAGGTVPLHDARFAPLRRFVYDAALAPLRASTLDMLLSCVALGRIGSRTFAQLSGDPDDVLRIDYLLDLNLLAADESGQVRVLPLVAAAAIENFGRRIGDLRHALVERMARHPVLAQSAEFERLSAAVPAAEITGDPHLWRATFMWRQHLVDPVTLQLESLALPRAAASEQEAYPYAELAAFVSAGRAQEARKRGDWIEERASWEQALREARETGRPAYIVPLQAQAAIGAWLAGDDAYFRWSIQKMDEPLDSPVWRAFRQLTRAAQGFPADEPLTLALPRFRFAVFMLRAAACEHTAQAVPWIERAMHEADAADDPVSRAAARLAYASLATDPSLRTRFESEAEAIAAAAGSPPARFDPVVRRFRSLAPAAPLLEVRVLSAEIYAGERLAVSDRVLELVLLLASAGRALTREEIGVTLEPDSEPSEIANAIKMTVRRARMQLRDPQAVTTSDTGYALGGGVMVDLQAVETLCARLTRPLLPAVRAEIERWLPPLCAQRPHRIARAEWFAPVELRIARARGTLAHAIAADALERSDFETVLRISKAMVAIDRVDETFYELAIRAHVAAGERALAAHDLREYQRALAEEGLECDLDRLRALFDAQDSGEQIDVPVA